LSRFHFTANVLKFRNEGIPTIFNISVFFNVTGHCWRSNEAAADLVLWKPQHGQKKPGRPKLDYATLLSKNTGLNVAELGTTMSSRECWRTVVMGSGAPD